MKESSLTGKRREKKLFLYSKPPTNCVSVFHSEFPSWLLKSLAEHQQCSGKLNHPVTSIQLDLIYSFLKGQLGQSQLLGPDG